MTGISAPTSPKLFATPRSANRRWPDSRYRSRVCRFRHGFRDSPEWGSAAIMLPYLPRPGTATGHQHDSAAAMSRYADYLLSRPERLAVVRARRLVRSSAPAAGHVATYPPRFTGTATLYAISGSWDGRRMNSAPPSRKRMPPRAVRPRSPCHWPSALFRFRSLPRHREAGGRHPRA